MKQDGQDIVNSTEKSSTFTENRHEFGTGFLVLKQKKSAIINFQPVNNRICPLRIKGKRHI